MRTAARGFLALGLDRYHTVTNIFASEWIYFLSNIAQVGLLGYNAPEWAISHLAAVHAGGLTTIADLEFPMLDENIDFEFASSVLKLPALSSNGHELLGVP